MTPAGIIGLGLWVPTEVRHNDAWPETFSTSFFQERETRRKKDFTDIGLKKSRPFDDVVTKYMSKYENDPFKGTQRRHVASPDEPSSVGDCIAAERALKDAHVDPKDIDLVLSSAMVPDRLAPTNGPVIQHQTGCTHASGIGVESFCSSALAQLDLAAALVESNRARYVLCVQSHQVARVNDLEVPFSPVFGDASTAFVVGKVAEGRGVVDVFRAGDGALAGAVTWDYRKTPGATWWRDAEGPIRPGSHDWQAAHFIGQNSIGFAIETVRAICERTHTPVDALGAIATIQPLVWFQSAIAEILGISPEKIPSTYEEYAHIGACGVIANLLAARNAHLLMDNRPIVLFGFGAGITRYAAMIRWHQNS